MTLTGRVNRPVEIAQIKITYDNEIEIRKICVECLNYLTVTRICLIISIRWYVNTT